MGGRLNNGLTYVLDGATHNEPYINANLPLPFPDALQEFKVETSALTAQYGQHGAGAVNAAIFTAEILGLSDPEIARRLVAHKAELVRGVAEKNTRLKQQLAEQK